MVNAVLHFVFILNGGGGPNRSQTRRSKAGESKSVIQFITSVVLAVYRLKEKDTNISMLKNGHRNQNKIVVAKCSTVFLK